MLLIVQAHAAAAVLNFSESCTPEILTPYLDGVISKLLVLLQVCFNHNIVFVWIKCSLSTACLRKACNQLLVTKCFSKVQKVIVQWDVLQNGKRMVQEGALTALASVADSAQVSFGESIFLRWAPRLFVLPKYLLDYQSLLLVLEYPSLCFWGMMKGCVTWEFHRYLWFWLARYKW